MTSVQAERIRAPAEAVAMEEGGPTSMLRSAAMGGEDESGAPSASELMARYAQGEDALFQPLYEALAPRLLAYLQRLLGARGGAEDVLQQTFMQIHLARGRFMQGARVEPWAYAIARAGAMDALRREHRRAARESSVGGLTTLGAPPRAPDEQQHASELSAAAVAELQGLSPSLREVFLLIHVDGLSHAEAAQVLGIGEGASKVRSHRARIWLRGRLARFNKGGSS